MHWHEIDLASGAQGQEVLEPGHACGAVGYGRGAEREAACVWHHVLLVCVNGRLRRQARLAPAASVGLIECLILVLVLCVFRYEGGGYHKVRGANFGSFCDVGVPVAGVHVLSSPEEGDVLEGGGEGAVR